MKKKKLSPQAQAALTRKKRAAEAAREAKLRSERARRAALIRWAKTPKVKKSPKTPTGKKKPGPKKLTKAEKLQRENAKLKRQLRQSKKKVKVVQAHSRQRNDQVKKFIQYQTPRRFTDISNLPERMKRESDTHYARRLVNQVLREGYYMPDQAYAPIAQAAQLSAREVYTLFMSPEVA